MGKVKFDEKGFRADLNAFLGKETVFEGNLDFKGALRIDGRFKGEIRSEDILIVGEGAQIEGSLEVGVAVIHGEVKGNIKASQKIQLRSAAKVNGDIATPSLSIEEGAFFDGQCKMAQLKAEKEPIPFSKKEEKGTPPLLGKEK